MERYQQELLVNKQFLNDTVITKEQIEKEFILKFLSSMPLNKLKLITNFGELDYNNEELWNDAELNNNEYMLKKLNSLASKKCIEFNVEIKI